MTTSRSGSSPAPAAAWASTSPRPRSPPATRSSPPPATPTGSPPPLGEHDDLLAVSLDITDPAAAEAAVEAAVERFGRIDVLVNNAGNFYAGYFEEISPEQFRAQMETNFFGPLNVTRAVLPVMRAQRSRPRRHHHLDRRHHRPGVRAPPTPRRSSRSKAGWSRSRSDVAPFGITHDVVEPGFFRTELLVEGASTIWPELSIDDYAERTDADHRRRGRA